MWSKAREAIKNSSEKTSVYIGCDSNCFDKRGVMYANYSTVIVVHKDSSKGAQVFHNSFKMKDYGVLETRLMMEVSCALEAFDAIKDVIGNRYLELHIDVNPDPHYASNRVSSQAIGWVRSMGIEAKIKPDSFAASSVADKVARLNQGVLVDA